jgi:hypothetical protein
MGKEQTETISTSGVLRRIPKRSRSQMAFAASSACHRIAFRPNGVAETGLRICLAEKKGQKRWVCSTGFDEIQRLHWCNNDTWLLEYGIRIRSD